MFRRTKRIYRMKKRSYRRNRFGKYTKRRVASRNKTLYFKRKALSAVVTQTTMAAPDLFGKATFALQYVTNYSDFTNLFDRYKIKAVKTDFHFMGAPVTSLQTQNANPTLFTVVDYNDDTTPASTASLLEYGKCRTHQFGPNRTVASVYFKPKLRASSWDESGALAGNYNPTTEPWLFIQNPGISHYGLKYGITGLSLSNAIEIYTTYYLAMRDSK